MKPIAVPDSPAAVVLTPQQRLSGPTSPPPDREVITMRTCSNS